MRLIDKETKKYYAIFIIRIKRIHQSQQMSNYLKGNINVESATILVESFCVQST